MYVLGYLNLTGQSTPHMGKLTHYFWFVCASYSMCVNDCIFDTFAGSSMTLGLLYKLEYVPGKQEYVVNI